MRVAGTVIWATDLAEHRAIERRRQGPAEDDRLQLFGELRGGAVGAADPRRRPDLGRRQAAARRRRRLQERDRLPALSRRRGPGGRSADRRGRRRRLGAGLSRPRLRRVRGFPARRLRQPHPVADLRGRGRSGRRSRSARSRRRSAAARSTAGATPALAGYAASGDSVRSAIAALADIVPLSLADDGAVLAPRRDGGAARPRSPGAPTSTAGARRRGAARAACPTRSASTYYDVGRDYQAGLQRATRGDGAPAGNADRRALPAALTAEGAKALAEFRLAAAWAGRRQRQDRALLARLRRCGRATG